MMYRMIYATVFSLIFLPTAFAAPTPVPSVAPNTPINQTPVEAGKWMGKGDGDPEHPAAIQSYVMFDVVGREVRNLRFVGLDFYCKYDDGREENFPFTHSAAGSSDTMNFIRLDQSGTAQTMIQVSDSGHWLRASLVMHLTGSTGFVDMKARSVPGPSGVAPKDNCKLHFERTSVRRVSNSTNPPPPSCGGYPWDPPECARPRPAAPRS